MGALNNKLRNTETGIAHFCPACKEPHIYTTKPGGRVCWSWNGNIDSPAFTPSMLILRGKFADPNFVGKSSKSDVCHYFLTDGKLKFCSDSTHELAGKTVELPDWPVEGDWAAFEIHPI